MYDRLAELPLVVDDYALEAASRDVSSDFTRVTTAVALAGGGETGRGEDVGYEAEDHRLYGGGQFELGVGRGQIQLLASLFYPDGPNDVAPGGYNDPDLPDDLPTSPLSPPADPVGFRW